MATAASRRFSLFRKLRSRASMALYGYTLRTQLGKDPQSRTFDGVAGEEHIFGPGFERPTWLTRIRSQA